MQYDLEYLEYKVGDLSTVDVDREIDIAMQNIVSITDRIQMAQMCLNDEGFSTNMGPLTEKLISVLTRKLEQEYELLDMFDRFKGLKELGVV